MSSMLRNDCAALSALLDETLRCDLSSGRGEAACARVAVGAVECAAREWGGDDADPPLGAVLAVWANACTAGTQWAAAAALDPAACRDGFLAAMAATLHAVCPRAGGGLG
eukprot:gene9609-14294_t